MWWADLPWIDVALGIVVLLMTLVGMTQGFVLQLFKLAGIVAVVVLYAPASKYLGPHVQELLKMKSPLAGPVVAVIVCLIAYSIFWIIGYQINQHIKRSKGPGGVNRKMGGSPRSA